MPNRSAPHRSPSVASPPRVALLCLLALLTALAGCGEKKKDRAAATVAARVNGGEVSLNQINLVLQQQRNLRPEQSDAASRQILERLIDQTLAVQKAEALGLERDPRVQQLVDAARRDVLARAYVDKLGETVPRPTPEDLRRYYDERPALFSERKVYLLQEVLIEAGPEQAAALRERIAAAPNLGALIELLKASELRYSSSQAVRGPETLPPAVLDMLQRMKEGQASVNAVPVGLQLMVLLGTRPQPLTEEAARPVIERQLLAERRRAAVQRELEALRAAARIEYLGNYAQGPRPGASAPPSIDVGTETAPK